MSSHCEGTQLCMSSLAVILRWERDEGNPDARPNSCQNIGKCERFAEAQTSKENRPNWGGLYETRRLPNGQHGERGDDQNTREAADKLARAHEPDKRPALPSA